MSSSPRRTLKATAEEANVHKLVEHAARVGGRILATVLVFVQGCMLNWFLAEECESQPSNAWYFFIVVDVVNALLISRCLWKSYETISRIKYHRKSEVNLPRLSLDIDERPSKVELNSPLLRSSAFSRFEHYALLPVAYGFYILTVVTRMCVVLARCLEDLDHFEGHNFMGLVALTALIFMLLVLSNHNAFPNSERRVWLDVVAGHVTLDVLDCSEFLESIFLPELGGRQDWPHKSLIFAVIFFSCVSLFSSTNFGTH